MERVHVGERFKNHYFLMRHGKSQANVEGIILSHPGEGTSVYGLVEEGEEQVRVSLMQAKEGGLLNADTIIHASDFTRTRETAEIAREVLGAPEVILTPKLRERFFGTYERMHTSNYEKVWADDVTDSGHRKNEVESVDEVLARTKGLVEELESIYTGKNILLVSHGDALQILQTWFEQVDPSTHRSLRHLETGEIRAVNE